MSRTSLTPDRYPIDLDHLARESRYHLALCIQARLMRVERRAHAEVERKQRIARVTGRHDARNKVRLQDRPGMGFGLRSAGLHRARPTAHKIFVQEFLAQDEQDPVAPRYTRRRSPDPWHHDGRPYTTQSPRFIVKRQVVIQRLDPDDWAKPGRAPMRAARTNNPYPLTHPRSRG